MSKKLYLLLLGICVTPVFAQDFASLTVTVVDSTDAVIPGAAVTALNTHRGTIYHDVTKNQGFVAFDTLIPGEYSIEVEKGGFKKYRVENLTLTVRARENLRVELHIAEANTTTVEVTDRPEVMSSDASQGISLDHDYLDHLPVNGRNAESLVLMTPGITSAAGGKGDGGFNTNGLRSNTNYYTLDGVSMNRSLGGGGGFGGGGRGPRGGGSDGPPGGGGTAGGSANETISMDAMQEVRVQTSSFSPEFGRSPGAQIAMTTRSGTNDLHATLFYYFRNTQLDANDWFANAGGYARGTDRQNRPGGVLGGPVLKKKTFFFVSFEDLQLVSPYTVIADVPDMATRASAPASLRPYLNAYPIPNSVSLASGAAQYRAVISNPSRNDTGSARLDHMFSGTTTLFLRYSRTPSDGERRGSDVVTPNVLSDQSVHSQTSTVGFSKSLDTGTLNDLRLNYSLSSFASHSTMDNSGGAVPLTNSIFPKGITSANGSFNFSMIGLAGYSYGGYSANKQNQFNVVDSVTRLRGNHHLKFGADYRRIMLTDVHLPYSYGVSFNGLSGNTYSFLTGYALNAQVSSNVGSVYPTYVNFSAYAQDTWRATDRTTLTYGLRWDVNPAPFTRSGPKPFAISSDPIAGVTQNDAMYPTRWTNIAPRVGLAYQMDTTQGKEMVFRTGFGFFYDVGYGVSAGAFNGAPYSSVRTISEVLFPLSASNLAAPLLPPARPYGQITTADAALKSPEVNQWNATLEKYFGPGQMLSVGYAGTSGKNLMRTQTSPAYSSAYDVLVQATNGATSSYHGLQVQYRKRVNTSFQTQFSYTWSHSIDSSSTDTGFGGGFASLFGSSQQGNSDYDIRQNLNFSGSYLLPAPKQGVLFSPLRHWYLDFVGMARTGLPFDIQGVSSSASGSTDTSSSSTSSNASVGLFANVRPEWNGYAIWINDANAPGGRRLNPAAFFIPTGYQQGNLPRNSLRGFGATQLDLSLRRDIPFTERWRLSIAAQAYNVFNHPNFSNMSPLEGASMSSPSFGTVTRMLNQSLGGASSQFRSGGSRSIELSMRLQF